MSRRGDHLNAAFTYADDIAVLKSDIDMNRRHVAASAETAYLRSEIETERFVADICSHFDPVTVTYIIITETVVEM